MRRLLTPAALFVCSPLLRLVAAPLALADPLDITSLICSAVPNVNGWSNATSLTFTWSAADAGAVAEYSYVLHRSVRGDVQDFVGSGSASTVTYGGEGQEGQVGGDLFFTVKAGQLVVVDSLPNCGSATVTLQIMNGKKLATTIPVGALATNAPLTYLYDANPRKGTYTYRVVATDLAGNAATSLAQRSWPSGRRLTDKSRCC